MGSTASVTGTMHAFCAWMREATQTGHLPAFGLDLALAFARGNAVLPTAQTVPGLFFHKGWKTTNMSLGTLCGFPGIFSFADHAKSGRASTFFTPFG